MSSLEESIDDFLWDEGQTCFSCYICKFVQFLDDMIVMFLGKWPSSR